MLNQIPVITIDGPSGSGKGTLGRLLAKHLHWHYLESGSLYRILAYAALQQGIDLNDATALAHLSLHLNVQFLPHDLYFRIFLSHQDITQPLQTEQCGNAASKIAAHPEVRKALLQQQINFRQAPGLVTDGRDMGTVVFPNAQMKLFLLANREERAKRRYNQLKDKGINVSLSDVLQELTERDFRDENRAISPLKPASDAILLDTTSLDVNQVFAKVLQLVDEVFGASIVKR